MYKIKFAEFLGNSGLVGLLFEDRNGPVWEHVLPCGRHLLLTGTYFPLPDVSITHLDEFRGMPWTEGPGPRWSAVKLQLLLRRLELDGFENFHNLGAGDGLIPICVRHPARCFGEGSMAPYDAAYIIYRRPR